MARQNPATTVFCCWSPVWADCSTAWMSASFPARCRIWKPLPSLNAGQLSFIVAAVLLGSVISTLFAGMLADWLGRKKMMALSGMLFVISIPMIALAQGYDALVLGRLLQGISGGLIGVVVPLYLAECLGASRPRQGHGHFSMAADARHRRGGHHRLLFQRPGG